MMRTMVLGGAVISLAIVVGLVLGTRAAPEAEHAPGAPKVERGPVAQRFWHTALAAAPFRLTPVTRPVDSHELRAFLDSLPFDFDAIYRDQPWEKSGEMYIKRFPDGNVLMTSSIDPPSRPGVLTFNELMLRDPVALDDIRGALAENPERRAAANQCIRDWIARGHTIGDRLKWTIVIEVESRNGVGRILSAEVDEWPPGFDDEVKRCHLATFRDIEFPTDHDYHFAYDSGACYYGPGGVTNEGEPLLGEELQGGGRPGEESP